MSKPEKSRCALFAAMYFHNIALMLISPYKAPHFLMFALILFGFYTTRAR